MLFTCDQYNKLTLQTLLGGYPDICLKILQEKNKQELETVKEEQQEIHFYYFLNHDLPLRSFLGQKKLGLEGVGLGIHHLLNVDGGKHLLYKYMYYEKRKTILGLDDHYQRVESLNTIRKKPWWKFTEKSTSQWVKLHNIIRLDLRCALFLIYTKEHNDSTIPDNFMLEYCFHFDRFREPNIVEDYQLCEKLLNSQGGYTESWMPDVDSLPEDYFSGIYVADNQLNLL